MFYLLYFIKACFVFDCSLRVSPMKPAAETAIDAELDLLFPILLESVDPPW
jgi:hypothetical protein